MVCVLVGQLTYNSFNSPRSKDVRGGRLVLAVLFFSLLIYFGLKKLPFKEFKYMTGLIFGMSGDKLIKKWINGKVWEKYDFVNKKKGDRHE